jgi:hypothetical protein
MPYRKSKPRKRPFKVYKKNYKRKSKYRNILSSFSPTVGFPAQFNTKLRYSAAYQLSETLGAVASQTFRGNDTNDPDQTGTGHQPTYYDQIGNIYGSVRVNGCKIKIKFINEEVTPAIVLLKASNGIPTLPSVLTDDFEDYMTKWNVLSGDSAVGQCTLSMYKSLKSVTGRQGVYDRYVLNSLNTSPTDQWYFTIAAQDADAGGTVTVCAIVTLTYYCTFYNRLDVSTS